jgi:signal transduction histidine kinase
MENQNNIVYASKTRDENQETFCLNELKEEMKIYAEQELAKIGRSHVKVEIFRDFYQEKFWVHTDRKRLRQILAILLDNAVKHTDTGYILFDFHISFFSPVSNQLRFFVDDTGYGVFNKNDLNYPIAQGLVQQMGGEMEVRPAGEAGSSVSFYIECVPFDVSEN